MAKVVARQHDGTLPANCVSYARRELGTIYILEFAPRLFNFIFMEGVRDPQGVAVPTIYKLSVPRQLWFISIMNSRIYSISVFNTKAAYAEFGRKTDLFQSGFPNVSGDGHLCTGSQLDHRAGHIGLSSKKLSDAELIDFSMEYVLEESAWTASIEPMLTWIGVASFKDWETKSLLDKNFYRDMLYTSPNAPWNRVDTAIETLARGLVKPISIARPSAAPVYTAR